MTLLQLNRNPITQAERVFHAFGGPRRLAELMALVGCPIDPSSLYRWNHPKIRRGCGGTVPVGNWEWLFQCAELAGVVITSEMLDPRPKPRAQPSFTVEEQELLA